MTTLINNVISEKNLYFLKSPCIQVFPCGRRRTQGATGNNIPIDPESKLLTEANTYHTIALNGYIQSFVLPIDSSSFIVAVAGYYFKIVFPSKVTDTKDVLNIIGDQVGASSNKVYANIIRINTPLYEEPGKEPLNTKVLGSLHANIAGTSEISLDIQHGFTGETPSDFYFSGLAFSAEPLNDLNNSIDSICILTKDNSGLWNVCRNSELPEIRHGDSENSVILGGVTLANGSGVFNNRVYAKYFDQWFNEVDAEGDPIMYPTPSLFLTKILPPENWDKNKNDGTKYPRYRLNFKYNE